MRNFEHINHEMRKIISSGLTKNKTAKEIADDYVYILVLFLKRLKETESYLEKLKVMP